MRSYLRPPVWPLIFQSGVKQTLLFPACRTELGKGSENNLSCMDNKRHPTETESRKDESNLTVMVTSKKQVQLACIIL